MNIKDVESTVITQDRLVAIFERQRELMLKYKDIEKMPEWPMDVNAAESQKWFKDFAWRTTEEITEATSAMVDDEDPETATLHYKEEIADALHFLVELCILIGFTPDTLLSGFTFKDKGLVVDDKLEFIFTKSDQSYSEMHTEQQPMTVERAAYGYIEQIGRAMNCLKNKPWKQTQILTDRNKFTNYIIQAFYAFALLCLTVGINDEDITDLYFRKSEVNKFRQRSNY